MFRKSNRRRFALKVEHYKTTGVLALKMGYDMSINQAYLPSGIFSN
jgi:hypothetical protein